MAQPPSREEVPEPGGAARATCHLLVLASELPIAGHESALVELFLHEGPDSLARRTRSEKRTPGRSTATAENLGAGHKSARNRLRSLSIRSDDRGRPPIREKPGTGGVRTTGKEGSQDRCSLLPESVLARASGSGAQRSSSRPRSSHVARISLEWGRLERPRTGYGLDLGLNPHVEI